MNNLWNDFKTSSPLVQIIVIAIPVLLCATVFGFFIFFLGILGGATAEEVPTAPAAAFATPTPILAAPTPTSEVIVFTDWRGEYFNNLDLQGEPVVVRNDSEINFDWGTNAPAPEVPAQNFSVRWTISRDVPAGVYRFTANWDNGLRLWIDDNLIADEWINSLVRSGSVDVNLTAGTHTVRLEYFHSDGPAVVQMRVDYLQNFPDWKAEYFDRPDLNSSPVVVRNEAAINYNWGTTSPIPGTVPDNNFAVRWTRTAEFDSDSYLFQISVEGGVRMWLDGQILIDGWGERELRQVEAIKVLDRGPHSLRIEYFKETGSGQIQVGWAKLEDPGSPPLAVINGASAAVVGQQVSFNARSSSVAEGSELVGFDWDFGDGNRAAGLDVTHVYNSPGDFAVTLTVIDDQGLSDTTVQPIAIREAPPTPQPDQPPIPIINAPSKARVGDIITFDSSQTISANPIARNVWEFGDGTRIDNSIKIQHVYLKPGTYRVKLTVEDNRGFKEVAFHNIRIRDVRPEPTPEPNQPPVARISAPASVRVGESFFVNAVESQCATTCTGFAWDMGDGTTANAVTFQHTYQSPGDFNIVLTVTDGEDLQGTANYIINVILSPPELPSPVIIIDPPQAEVEQSVTFDGSQSQPGGGGNIVSYNWDFGDGNTASGQTVTHQYATDGEFRVTLSVSDQEGYENIAESTVQITAGPEIQPTEEPTPPEIEPTEEPEPDTPTPEPEPENTPTPEPQDEHAEDVNQ